MERKRHSRKEISALLLHADDLAAEGSLQRDIARALGVSVMTLHRWRKARGGKRSATVAGRSGAERAPEPNMTAFIEELERENARLRILVTDLLLEKSRLEEALERPGTGRVRHMLGRRLARA